MASLQNVCVYDTAVYPALQTAECTGHKQMACPQNGSVCGSVEYHVVQISVNRCRMRTVSHQYVSDDGTEEYHAVRIVMGMCHKDMDARPCVSVDGIVACPFGQTADHTYCI